MPRKTSKSGLFGKLGTAGRKAFEAHRGDETKLAGGAELPAGIENGVAQLTQCYFKQYETGDNKGEYFFYAAGIVKAPAEHNGVPIEGLRTSIMEPICDTPNRSRATVDDHFAWICNALRLLGVDMDEVDANDLEAILEALQEDKPHFRFRTWIGQASEQFPNPRTNHDWRGICDYEDSEEDDDVVDETEDEPEEEEEESDEGEDLAALGKAADNDDDDAITKLIHMAEEAGIEAANLETWSDVADAIAGNNDNEEEEEGIPFEPEKGEVVEYKPPRARKALTCEVTAAFVKKETCNLKDLEGGKMFKGVAWDKVSLAE